MRELQCVTLDGVSEDAPVFHSTAGRGNYAALQLGPAAVRLACLGSSGVNIVVRTEGGTPILLCAVQEDSASVVLLTSTGLLYHLPLPLPPSGSRHGLDVRRLPGHILLTLTSKHALADLSCYVPSSRFDCRLCRCLEGLVFCTLAPDLCLAVGLGIRRRVSPA